MQNGFVESFNERLRDECLTETLFTSLAHARFVLDAWRHDYNHVRPHSKLGGKTPAEIAPPLPQTTIIKEPDVTIRGARQKGNPELINDRQMMRCATSSSGTSFCPGCR